MCTLWRHHNRTFSRGEVYMGSPKKSPDNRYLDGQEPFCGTDNKIKTPLDRATHGNAGECHMQLQQVTREMGSFLSLLWAYYEPTMSQDLTLHLVPSDQVGVIPVPCDSIHPNPSMTHVKKARVGSWTAFHYIGLSNLNSHGKRHLPACYEALGWGISLITLSPGSPTYRHHTL